MHRSVFLDEAVRALNIMQGKKYVDATYGQGGHSGLIASLGGEVIGIDQDLNQVNKAKDFKVYNGNFSQIKAIVKKHGWGKIDGIIFDLGLSMDQIKYGGIGLSYRNDNEILDMRLSHEGLTASQILNELPEADLISQLSKYSEDIYSKKIAEEIVRKRQKRDTPWTVADLQEVVDKVTGLGKDNSKKTLARIFQALRMIVNNEISNLKVALNDAFELLEKDGVMVVITFHSVEDRVVKQIFNSLKDVSKNERINVAKKRKLLSFERSATLRVLKKNV